MTDFEKEVPFDPGWSKFSTSFMDYVEFSVGNILKLKVPNQVKFQITKHEAGIVKKFKACASVYLGCVLWGGYLKTRFKDSPKSIMGNPAEGMSQEQAEEKFLYREEPEYMLDYLDKFNKNFKRYVKRPSKVAPEIAGIIKAYLEFLQINHNFGDVVSTDQIKLPAALSHFDDLSPEKLDELKDKIFNIIATDRLEDILEIGFYNN